MVLRKVEGMNECLPHATPLWLSGGGRWRAKAIMRQPLRLRLLLEGLGTAMPPPCGIDPLEQSPTNGNPTRQQEVSRGMDKESLSTEETAPS